jgi:hypothetical protein
MMHAVPLTKEEMATAVAGMQYMAQEIDKIAAQTEGLLSEHNQAEAKRIREVAAKLAVEWGEMEYTARIKANGL